MEMRAVGRLEILFFLGLGGGIKGDATQCKLKTVRGQDTSDKVQPQNVLNPRMYSWDTLQVPQVASYKRHGLVLTLSREHCLMTKPDNQEQSHLRHDCSLRQATMETRERLLPC